MATRESSSLASPLSRTTAAAHALAAALAVAAIAAAGAPPAGGAVPPDSLFAAAERLYRAGAPDSARGLVEPVLAQAIAAGDAGLELKARLYQASALCATGKVREGEATARRALALARAAGDSARARMAIRWLGYALLGQGRDDEALARYRELLERALAAGDRREEAYARLVLAYRELTAGDSRAAIAGYERAAALFVEVGETAVALDARIGLARAYAREGRYDEMRRLYLDIIEQARRSAGAASSNPAGAASSNPAGADTSNSAGAATNNPAGARAKIAAEAAARPPAGAAVSIPANARTPLNVARRFEAYALNNLAGYESEAGDPKLAVAYWEQALSLLRAMGDLRTLVTPSLNLASAQMELGEFDAAVAQLEELARRCEREGYGSHLGLALVQLGVARSAYGQTDEAVATWERVLTLGEAPLDARAEALQLLALAHVRAGHPAVALASLDRLAPALLPRLAPAWRGDLAYARAAALAALGRRAEALASLADALSAARAGGFRLAAMRARLQQARCELALGAPDSALAHLRLAQLAWEELRTVPRDPRWREQRGALGGEIHLELARLLACHPPASPPDERVRAAFDALQRYKARTLRERLLGPDAFAAGLSGAAPPVTLARLQAAVLREGDLLLDYYLGEEGSLLLAATRDTCAVAALPPRRALAQRSALYHELAAAPPDGTAGAAARDAAAARLDRELLGPVAGLVDASRRVILAPDGPLNLLPLEQLPALAGREAFRVPSATLLAVLAEADAVGGAGEADGAAAAAIAGAVAPPSGLLVLTGRELPDELRLPGAEAEVRWLRRSFRRVRVAAGIPAGEKAGPDTARAHAALAALAAGREVLHVAAHAEAFDQRPWNSRILVGADANGQPVHLEAAAIAARRLDPRLAVLSGCETAGGRVLSGEGVLGLTGAFLSAGARATVVALWPVDDVATQRLMRRFYRELAQGRTVAGSLRRAQAALAAAPETSDPFYWAGFVVVGDGGITVTLARRPPAILVFAALVALGAAVPLAVTATRGRRSRRRL